MVDPYSPTPVFKISSASSVQLAPVNGQTSNSPSTGNSPAMNTSERRRWALVVDDIEDVTDMLSVLMTHAGYEVSTASSAREAISLAQVHQFDLIVSDIGMPVMNGYQLAETLRRLPGYENIPMVAVTGYSRFDDRNRSLTAGFTEHVTKPIDPRAFLALLDHL
jgi:CheY-like chemotaxis protein